MGIQKVSSVKNQTQMQTFVRALLKDLEAMEYMLKNDWFENDITRIGAEQELCIVDAKTMKPAPINGEILKRMSRYSWIKPELAKYNLETNLMPREFTGNSLRLMEKEGKEYLETVRKEASALGTDIIMTGILPTIHRHDIQMHNLTANKRYLPLLNATKDFLHGNPFTFHIRGIDELILQSHSTLFPGCNTSFQVHFQVSSDEFVKYYNIAQFLTPYLLAVTANSPIAFGKRLWHETRMILYPQGSDTRLPQEFLRKYRPRASFGDAWLEGSILNLYKDDISRYRILLGGEIEEDSIEMIKTGKTPALKALQVHNSTVYRWNRPCYGISPNGQPHLRIENRVISAGPTILDEMANAAFWLGLMVGLGDSIDEIQAYLPFSIVKDNFERASKFGIQSELIWLNNQSLSASQLILEKLLPIARKGLEKRNIDSADIERYLGVIEARAKNKKNGATWALESYENLKEKMPQAQALAALTLQTIKNQKEENPVHDWEIMSSSDLNSIHSVELKIEEIMQTDLITVMEDDLLEFAMNIMNWRNTTSIAVENNERGFVGLIHGLDIQNNDSESASLTVKDIVINTVITVTPETNITKAKFLMKEHQLDYLPVVQSGKLIGMVAKEDFPVA